MSSTNEITGWLQGRLPDAWFTGAAEVTIDREEILVLGHLAAPEGIEGEPDGPEMTEAAHGRISRFREDTRQERIAHRPRGASTGSAARSRGAPSAARCASCSPTWRCR